MLSRGAAGAALMMRLLDSVSFTPYVIYRIGLGIVLLVDAYRLGRRFLADSLIASY